MKLKLAIDLQDGRGARVMQTNLFVATEWERLRPNSDMAHPKNSDVVCIAYILCKMSGDIVPPTWQEWIAKNPNAEITPVDEEKKIQSDPTPITIGGTVSP